MTTAGGDEAGVAGGAVGVLAAVEGPAGAAGFEQPASAKHIVNTTVSRVTLTSIARRSHPRAVARADFCGLPLGSHPEQDHGGVVVTACLLRRFQERRTAGLQALRMHAQQLRDAARFDMSR